MAAVEIHHYPGSWHYKQAAKLTAQKRGTGRARRYKRHVKLRPIQHVSLAAGLAVGAATLLLMPWMA